MGGICGVVDFRDRPVRREVVLGMAAASPFRSPDGVSSWARGSVALAQLALHATAESERERQPLLGDDGRYCVVADARIDNRAELLRRLYDSEDRTRGRSDAEIILAAFERWGIDSTLELVGDFAFAIWDQIEQRLFCARDALGVRRLHYARAPGILCFATDAQQVVAHPAIPRRLDRIALARYLARDLDDERGSMFTGVNRLPPAHVLVADGELDRVSRYWDIDPEASIRYERPGEYAEHLRDQLRKAVVRRTRTQAPRLAVEMSGGLDSTTIAALALEAYSRDEARPKPIALSFAFDSLGDCDERRYSSRMNHELGLDVEYIDLEDYWLLGDGQAYEPELETPFMAWDAGHGRLAERARSHGARVVLTGQSGDGMMFGDVSILSDLLRSGQLRKVARDVRTEWRSRRRPMRSIVYRGLVEPFLPGWADGALRAMTGRRKPRKAPGWMNRESVAAIEESSMAGEREAASAFESVAKMRQYRSVVARNGASWWGYLYDRSLGRHGVEARHPFLDRPLAEFVMALPPEVLFEAGTRKPLLRQATRGLLPEEVRTRSDRTSFSAFIDFSLRRKERNALETLFRAPVLAGTGIVDENRVRALVQGYLRGKEGNNIEVWLLVTAERWLRAHWQ